MQEVIIIAVSVLSLIVSIAVLIIVLKKNNNQEDEILPLAYLLEAILNACVINDNGFK